MSRLGTVQGALTARGMDAPSAAVAARRILDGIVSRQASVLAFERMFLFAALCFLLVIPLALVLRAPRGARAPRGGGLH